ncbi:hypothetical protein KCU78_g32, partial [Aureobasidium melanogenum]
LTLRSRFAIGRHAPSAETNVCDRFDLLFPCSINLFPVAHAVYQHCHFFDMHSCSQLLPFLLASGRNGFICSGDPVRRCHACNVYRTSFLKIDLQDKFMHPLL